jgi:hypothetical protein
MNLSPEIISELEMEAMGLTHGIVKLELHVRDSNLYRYTVSRERSVIAADTQSADHSMALNKMNSEKSTIPVAGMRNRGDKND